MSREKLKYNFESKEKPWTVDGWMDGWMGGWVDGWVEAKAGLRIAYSKEKVNNQKKQKRSNFKK